MKPNPASLFLVVSMFITPQVMAADGTWSSTSGGNWSDTPNWSGGTIADGSGSAAYFTSDISADSAVALNGDRTIGNLVFSDNGAAGSKWTISGNTLTLASGSKPAITTTTDAAISSNLSGSAGFTKTGSGRLTLSGTNNNALAGGIVVDQGTLTLAGANNGNSLAGSGTLSVNTGATIASTSKNPLGWGGASTPGLNISGGTLNAGDDFQFNSLTMTDGSMSIATNNWFSYGDVTVNASTSTGSTISGGNFVLRFNAAGTASGTRIFNVARGTAAADLTISSALANPGAGGVAGIEKTGTGIMVLSNASNTYTGTTTINGGRLKLTDATSFASSGVAVNSGTLELNRSTGTWNVSTVLGGSGAIEKTGDGTAALTADSSGFAGTTTVSAGTLLVTGQLGGNMSVEAGATVGGTGSVGNLNFATDSFFDIYLTFGDSLEAGTVSFGSGTEGSRFGIDNLRWNGGTMDWSGFTDDTPYTLITGAVDTSNLDNLGLANAYDIGGGRKAYFQQGSLQLVVVPEPAVALLGGLGLLALLRRRRA